MAQASLLRRAFNSLSRLGLKRSAQTLLSMAEDQWFDHRYRTDTTKRVAQAGLRVLSPDNQSEARPYFPTRARAVRYAIRRAGVPTDKGFVDVGSGKGKVMLVAATMGFQKIKGIEFAPELHRIACDNMARLAPSLPTGAAIQPICADATQYELANEDCVFFMFNPFGGHVMAGFCHQVLASLTRCPRKIWIIYADPAAQSVIESALPVRETQRFTYGGYLFVVLNN